jgi:hypothetical protein
VADLQVVSDDVLTFTAPADRALSRPAIHVSNTRGR